MRGVIDSRRSLTLPAGAAFWLMGALFGVLMFAASAPSPLYDVYAAAWHFSETTLTVVFAVYAVALLAALLVVGRLSDHLGRRPVILAALVVEVAAMALFIGAHSAVLLGTARVLQGIATGGATGAISASLVELQPADRPALGSLVNSSAPMIGLAVGAVAASLLVQYAPAPMRLVYWLLLAAFAVGILAVLAVGEPGQRRPGAGRSLRPRASIPRAARWTFAAATPCLVALWALGGLYMALGPGIAGGLLHSGSALPGGLVIFLLAGTGGVSSILLRASRPATAMVAGCLALAAGVGGTVAATAAGSAAGFFVTTVVAGFGFGLAFLGVFRTLSALAEPAERAGLIATIYIVSYLAFSLPVIGAGVAATHVGLRSTAIAYGAAVAVLALAALVGLLAGARRAVPAGAVPAGAPGRPRHALPPCPATVPMCLHARPSGSAD